MKAIYWVRVSVVSLEACVLLVAGAAWVYFGQELGQLATSLSLNDEFLKYLMLAPLGLGLWVANDSRLLLQEDKETTRILTSWPDYPKLKVHIWVGLIYAAIFAGLSVVPWVVKAGITTGGGLLLFVASIAGQLIVASSVYSARIKVKELIAHVGAP